MNPITHISLLFRRFMPKPKRPVVIDKPHLFLDVLREYIDRYVTENQLHENTVAHYDQRYRNIHMYLASKQLTNITLPEVKRKHMDDLRSWLYLNTKTRSKRHPSLHIELCKRTMAYAVTNEYTAQDWLSPIRGQRDKPKPIIHLTLNEVRKLLAYQFSSDIFRIVADRFLFQCFTGLSHSEVDHYILVEISDRLWIDGSREKNTNSEYIYLFDEAKAIHDKYNGRIPRVANQTCNEIIKEIAGLLNIPKHLTTHVARKTHATLLDEYGVTTKTIARQLRNSERICDENYIAKSHLRTETEMERLGLTKSMLIAS